MSLHSIFNSLWNMDLTFIFKVTFLILGVFVFAIFGYGFLLWIGDKLEVSETCTTFIEKYYEKYSKLSEKYSKLSGLKKFFVNMTLFTIYATICILCLLYFL